MSVLRWLPACVLTLTATAALADPPVILSAAPDAVAVTVYRAPERGKEPIDKNDPAAFALIAETRTIDLPPGIVTVRFEGVAGGIVPQSAILFGTDPRERNRDAALLSQKGLVDAYTGQQVIVRRTDPATGKVIEERARILSAADRLIIQTSRGAEAVYCSGLAQTLLYPRAPTSLSAKPVLTMTTKDQPGGRATVTLAYIATGFDWDATYVGTLSPDGQSLALFAWLTMASADETSFVDATTAAVAGRINRSDETRDDTGSEARAEARDLNLRSHCWPAGTTSDGPPSPPPIVAAPAPIDIGMAADNIVVTAQRREEKLQNAPIAVTAVAEGLGDLKLYRIPVPVTVAARSQKQVAFLAKPAIKGKLVYRSVVWGDAPDDPQLLFRFSNRKESGLGEPFPAGSAIIYQDSPIGRQLVGETSVEDKTVGEDVELVFGAATNVTVESNDSATGEGYRHDVTLRNANPFPVRFELEFRSRSDVRYSKLPGRIIAKPGKQVWSTMLPPNSTRMVSYNTADVD